MPTCTIKSFSPQNLAPCGQQPRRHGVERLQKDVKGLGEKKGLKLPQVAMRLKANGGVMNWEIGIDIYTLICIKWITNKNLLYKKINKK